MVAGHKCNSFFEGLLFLFSSTLKYLINGLLSLLLSQFLQHYQSIQVVQEEKLNNTKLTTLQSDQNNPNALSLSLPLYMALDLWT